MSKLNCLKMFQDANQNQFETDSFDFDILVI